MSEKKNPNFSYINERIAEGIKKEANDGAVDRVVQKRVEAEIARRADLLEKALDKYNTAKKELAKCGPDLISHGVVEDSGTPVKQLAYSDKRWKEREALGKTIADLDIAIMKAMGAEADYSKLQSLIGGAKPKTDGSAE